MKKIIYLSLGMCSLLLLSFVGKETGVKKIGEGIYQVSTTARFSETEKTEIQRIIGKHYNIRDFSKTVSLSPIRGADGSSTNREKTPCNWIIDTKAFLSAVDKKAIKYDVKAPAFSKDETILINILDKYAQK